MKFNYNNQREVEKQLNKMQDIIRTGLPERVFVKVYRNAMMRALGSISYDMKLYMRQELTTPTGDERKRKGGRFAGRDRAGEPGAAGMVKAYGVNKRTGSYKDGKYIFRLGWNENAPRHTIFQEYGTKRGIQAMNVLGETREQMEELVKELRSKRGRYNLLRDIGDQPIAKIRHQQPQPLPPSEYQGE